MNRLRSWLGLYSVPNVKGDILNEIKRNVECADRNVKLAIFIEMIVVAPLLTLKVLCMFFWGC